MLVSKPSALFDPYAALAALEQLVDSAREVKDDKAKRYSVILLPSGEQLGYAKCLDKVSRRQRRSGSSKGD